MELDTLYKRAKTGKIQYWKVAVLALTYPTIFKESGQLGTFSPLQHMEAIKEGKNIGKSNETTPMEQAISQASSDWLKKKDEGYKSLKDLGIEPCSLKEFEGKYHYPGCGVMYMPLDYSLDQTLPQFNTGATGAIKPMKAPKNTLLK